MAMYPLLHGSDVITKHGPILTKDDMPFKASLIFNAGVAKFNGRYVMVFRNDYGDIDGEYDPANGKLFEGTSVGVAFSDNGIDGWEVRKMPLTDCPIRFEGENGRLYDPRLTIIDGVPYLCMARDTKHGIRGVIARVSPEFDSFEILHTTVPDNRNMALFPEKIGGMYVRFERPMPVYGRGRDRFDFWLSVSPDLRFWGDSKLVLGVEDVPYANDKIGPAAPPIKTEKGWLATFHAVDRDDTRGKNGWEKKWTKRYCAGLVLLDLDDPSKVIGMVKPPLIAPEEPYEVTEGFREDVIFPGGMILEDSGEVKIYYGASDTVECLATADVNDLLKLCTESK